MDFRLFDNGLKQLNEQVSMEESTFSSMQRAELSDLYLEFSVSQQFSIRILRILTRIHPECFLLQQYLRDYVMYYMKVILILGSSTWLRSCLP